jgi:pimeloyl-ACP methyl ester carboxylesterase
MQIKPPLLVCVLGFYGSSERHVTKYANMWKTNVFTDCKVMMHACNSNFQGLITLGKEDATTVSKRIITNYPNHNVIFHVLSNRGASVYLKLLPMLPPTIEVKGIVFDSCPGSLHPYWFFRATAANQKQQWLKMTWNGLPWLLLSLSGLQFGWKATLFMVLFTHLTNKYILTRLYHRAVSDKDRSKCPSLFIYSEADELVSYTSVEHVAKRRQAIMGGVSVKKFQDSAHVKHLMDHEVEYVQTVQDFVKTCDVRQETYSE